MAPSKPQADQSTTAESKSSVLEDYQINVKLKLAALWTSIMFLYAYVDILSFYRPGTIDDILVGKAFVFDISPMFILTALVFMTLPILMIFLSVALPAKVNRWTNIVVGIISIPFYAMFTALGETWSYYYYGAGVEVVLLALVVWYAWKWPRTPADATQRAEANDRKTVQPQD